MDCKRFRIDGGFMKRTFAFWSIIFFSTMQLILLTLCTISVVKHQFHLNIFDIILIGIVFTFPIFLGLSRHYEIGEDTLQFRYLLRPKTDRYNNDSYNRIYLDEVFSVLLVNFSLKEKNKKEIRKCIFNKYLKIDLKSSQTKYINISLYANYQINSIIKLLNKNNKI